MDCDIKEPWPQSGDGHLVNSICVCPILCDLWVVNYVLEFLKPMSMFLMHWDASAKGCQAKGCQGYQGAPGDVRSPSNQDFLWWDPDIPKTCLPRCLASASNSGLRAPTPCNLPVQAEIFISGIIRGQVQPFIEGGFVQGKWWRQLRAITLRWWW